MISMETNYRVIRFTHNFEPARVDVLTTQKSDAFFDQYTWTMEVMAQNLTFDEGCLLEGAIKNRTQE